MPKGRGSGSLKDRELYEELRNEGVEGEGRAHLERGRRDGAESGRPPRRQGRRLRGLDRAPPAQAGEGARDPGYSGKRKAELISMLRNH